MESAAAPLYVEVAESPVDGSAFWLTTEDGVRLRAAIWNEAAPKGTVFLFPGRTEYVEKYGRTAVDLQDRGLATLAVDWRGQGLSQRLLPDKMLGHVGAFADYQRDVAALLAFAGARNLPRPYYLLAHSMGGAIALRALMLGFPVQAAAMTSPMWGIKMAAALRPVAWTLSTLSRPLGFGHLLAPGQARDTYLLKAPFDDNTLTTDPGMWDYMKRQAEAHPDLSLGGPSLQWLNEGLRETRALSRCSSPPVPCLTILGTDEMIVEAAPIRSRMAQWPEGSLEIVQGARHEILMETRATQIRTLDAVAAHFLAAA